MVFSSVPVCGRLCVLGFCLMFPERRIPTGQEGGLAPPPIFSPSALHPRVGGARMCSATVLLPAVHTGDPRRGQERPGVSSLTHVSVRGTKALSVRSSDACSRRQGQAASQRTLPLYAGACGRGTGGGEGHQHETRSLRKPHGLCALHFCGSLPRATWPRRTHSAWGLEPESRLPSRPEP